MFTKWIKLLLIIAITLCIVGGLLFGKDLVSYLRSSAKSVQSAVKGSVPIDFELCRARDLLDEIIPEMHANIRLIAQEEVEVANLTADIQTTDQQLIEEKQRISKLRQSLDLQHADYTFADRQFSRSQVKDNLSRRFERFKESELILAGKKRLLAAREKSLQAAMQLLDRTKAQKFLLEDKIEALAGQWRVIQASAVGSAIQVDNSKLAQTEKLINQIKKRLDVAERVLNYENRLEPTIPVDDFTETETELIQQIDEYFTPQSVRAETDSTNNNEQLCLLESTQ